MGFSLQNVVDVVFLFGTQILRKRKNPMFFAGGLMNIFPDLSRGTFETEVVAAALVADC